MESTPFYQDSNTYAVIIALAAFILSLIPYLKKLRNGKLDLDIYNMIWITHSVGNPIIEMSLIIKNIGGRDISVKNINIELIRDGERLINLPLKHYFQKTTDKQPLLFRKFTLVANAEWNYNCRFLNFLKREDNKLFKDSDKKLRNELRRLKQLPENTNPISIVHTDESFTEAFKILFDKYFIWKEGNYTLKLNIETENNTNNINKSFNFTIFKSLETEFIDHKSDYTSGDRINWFSDNYHGDFIEIEEKGN